MNQLPNFKFWVQKTLPQVYDESLSYYELLNKTVYHLNEVIDSQNETNTNFGELNKLFIDLNKYVDTYFTNLDVQVELNNKLDNMAANGTLDTIINHNIFGDLNRQLEGVAEKIVYITDKRFDAKGDGTTDDTQAIQKAIDHVYNRGGGVVAVPFSNNPFIFTALLVKTNVVFKGEGGTLKLKDGVCVNKDANYYPIHNLNHDNVIYDGLIVDGNQENNTLFRVADIITCTGENSQVINCHLMNAPDSGIMFSDAKNGRCQNNTIINCRDLGIYVNGSTEEKIGGAIVSDNIIGQSVAGGIGIKRKSSHVTVSDNTIFSCGNGITIEDFTSSGMGYPTDLTVVNNTMKDIGYMYRDNPIVAQRGISISRTERSNISNNNILNCSGAAIVVKSTKHTKVNDNILTGYPSVQAVSGNNAFVIEDVEDTDIKNNIVNNFVGYGAYVIKTLRGSIEGNTFVSTGGTGLRINATCLETVVRNNIIEGVIDTQYYNGHTCILKDNIIRGAAEGSPERLGILTITAGQPLPNAGSVKPNHAGQLCVHKANNTWWIANSTAVADWKQITN